MNDAPHPTLARPRQITPAGAFELLVVVASLWAPVRGFAQTPQPGPGGTRSTGAETDRLARALDSLRSSLEIPGATAAIVGAEGVRWAGASGIAAPSRPMEPGLILEIGSATKPFTAALVLTLIRDGLLSLDDRLARWRPAFPDAEGVTVRHLLQHTSGLHDCTEHPEYLPALRADFTKVWTPEDCFALMGDPYFPPGAGWHYSNTNYHLLGIVVEQVTGKPFARALRSRILEPLGLEDTWFDATEDPGRPRAHAFLDIDGDGSPEDLTALVPNTSFITAAGAAGALVTTARDLARFGHLLWTGEVVRGTLFEEMTAWVERGDGMEYGLGVIREVRDGRPYMGHKGNTAGYSAALWHDVEAGLTVAVLTNAHLRDVTPVAMDLLERAR